ncbi:MAG: DUF952 domain-containing protein [Deltaproteobacteria bacterium]|nr:DUF952 domain-containing protein [Deltaproteobacteria bacterium]
MILHILRRSEWEEALRLGTYRPPSLTAEGFIHCSTMAQVIDTANAFFRGATDLMILRIDERKLTSPLKFETPAGPGDDRPRQSFPHIYGPLNLDAVIYAIEFPCEANGSFQLPEMLLELPED